MHHLRLTTAAIVLAAALALSACGDDDDGGSAETTAAGADVATYCDMSRELDEAGSEIFEELESDPDATRQDYADAEAELVEQIDPQLDELTEVAPEEIAEEVDVLVAAVRARGGLTEDAPDEQAARDAEKAIAAFEKENCGNAGS